MQSLLQNILGKSLANMVNPFSGPVFVCVVSVTVGLGGRILLVLWSYKGFVVAKDSLSTLWLDLDSITLDYFILFFFYVKVPGSLPEELCQKRL